MDWIEETKRIFKTNKPAHFTDFSHCEECSEHDQTLIASTVDEISLVELGNPGWDPICFCSEEGKKYYMPAFVRLSLCSMEDEFYFGQLLFHIEYDGENNAFLRSCTSEQKQFIANFVEQMLNTYPEQIESNNSTDVAFNVHSIWSNA